MLAKDRNGATPLDLATDNHPCRDLLKNHAIILDRVHDNPAIFISAVLAHCTELFTSGEAVPAPELALHSYHLEPSFLWVPSAARVLVFKWARNAYIAQTAASIKPLAELPDDCAGDILEFLTTMPRTEPPHIVAHCSSPEAHAWVRAVVTVALEVANAVNLATLSVNLPDPGSESLASFTLCSFSLARWCRQQRSW